MQLAIITGCQRLPDEHVVSGEGIPQGFGPVASGTHSPRESSVLAQGRMLCLVSERLGDSRPAPGLVPNPP